MGWAFRTIVSSFLCLAAGTLVWTTLAGETSLEVAYPMFAFISSTLIAVGLVRSGGLNVPVALGSLVAVIGASFWLTAVLKGDLQPGSWERATITLYFVGMVAIVLIMGIFVSVIRSIQDRELRTAGAYTLGFLSMIGFFAVPGIYVFVLIQLIGKPLE